MYLMNQKSLGGQDVGAPRRISRSRLAAVLGVLTLLASAGHGADAMQCWLYTSRNLLVDQNVTDLEALFRRAASAGYTHVLVSDSKFGRLADMDEHYFRNVERIKRLAVELHLEIVPAVFPIGYSNDILSRDPNLIEALPVRDALFVVHGGSARLEPDGAPKLKGGDYSDRKQGWWKDETVTSDQGAALIRDPKGQNARISQKLSVTPFRQYHIALRVKTQDFRGTLEVKLLAGEASLNYNNLGAKRTQDWTTHHVVFNSLDHSEVNLYIGCWGATTGSLWVDDAQLEEVGLLNLVRRPGAPLEVRKETGERLEEGKDLDSVRDPKMGTRPWLGEYDVYHESPVIRTALPEGSRLRVSYYHAVTVYDGQAMICPSEPKTLEVLRDQAERVHRAWGAKGYMMSHDEIRVMNWCKACQRRHLDAGAILADNARACIRILREVNPGGTIYVWSDMFDPNHNAHKDYYLVRGDLAGSWEGLDAGVVIIPWYFEKRVESLKWFAGRGNAQVIAGYYDTKPEQIRDWIAAAKPVKGVLGVMYTTWESRFDDLTRFAEVARESWK